MTSSKRKVATSNEGHADLAPPPRSRPRLVSSPESSTQLVPTSIMEGIEPTHSETPTSVERLQGAPNDNPKFDHDDYTVAWICPLEVEEIAARKMLDVRHQPLSQPENDHNAYTLGSINGHNVVIASLPVPGNSHAATVVTQTRNTFRHVRFGLLVGIGGGVPTKTENGPIRLGHVVVSKPTGTHSGAVQYDHGKVEHHERDGVAFERTGCLERPPMVLLGATRKLNIARSEADSDPILDHLKRIDTRKPNLKRFKCPGIDNDHLYKPDYVHSNRKASCRKCGCDPKQRVDRFSDYSDNELEEADPSENVVVHEGTIASGEWVMKNGLQRDQWAEKDDILCFEMEAAGALADFPCLIIRGISDYADSHKNDRWHGFSAAVAAAYARELFFHMPLTEVKGLRATEADVKRIVTGTSNLVQTQLNDKIKTWLSPPDPSTNYNAASAKHLDGTGSWLIKSEEFLSWRTTLGPSALWLHGSPGCGKTILTYSVIKDLRQAHGCSNTKCPVLYYFFDFNDIEKQSPENMVRSLIFQLSSSCEDAGKHLKRLFQKTDNGNSKPSVQSLCATFQAMLNEAEETMIILDALDECATRQDRSLFGGQRLLDWMGKLQCRILMTSRREEDIELSINKWSAKIILSMQHTRIDQDIRAYVHKYLRSPDTNELAETWQSKPDVLDHIESRILEKAGGMFRWVACQLDALAEHRMRHRLFAALESLPTTLAETYRRILQGIPEVHQNDTARLLQFVLYAKRPLTTKEAADALAVTPQCEQRFDEENRPSHILKYCSNLATISSIGTIYLAHFSVKEYLTSDDDKGPFTKLLVESEAEASITEVILAYISCLTGDFKSDSGSDDWGLSWINDKYPLAEYCACHWMDHARVAEQVSEEIREKIFNFVSHPKEMPYINCLRQFDPDGSWAEDTCIDGPASPLYLASINGLFRAVERLIHEGADVNEVCRGTSYGYALHAACEEQEIKILKLLLDKGAKVNQLGGVTQNSALMIAVGEGLEEAIQLLLDGGADPNMQSNYHYPEVDGWADIYPLYLAAYGGRKRLVELLLEKGADVNQESKDGTALCAASQEGHEDVVMLLLQYGAKVDETSLVDACFYNNKELVRILLGQLDPNTCSHDFCNEALCNTCPFDENGQEIIELFLKHGVDINAVSRNGDTALENQVGWLSCERNTLFLFGKGATHFRLVSSGLKPNRWPRTNQESPEGDDERLFRAACWQGWGDVIRLLLRKNTDAQITQGAYNDGLQIASYQGFDTVVELLLNNGSNVNAEPGELGDALQAASARGQLNIVKCLLKNGANPDRVDQHGWSALSIALRYNFKSISKELLRVSTGETPVESNNPSRCLPPSTFVADDTKRDVTIYSDECVVEAGQNIEAQLVRANHPFTARERKVYFEIKVLDMGAKGEVGLGVCSDEIQPGVDLPEFQEGSWGYYGVNGLSGYSGYIGNFSGEGDRFTLPQSTTTIKRYGPTFHRNDIIGCCIDYDADQLFFTKNGQCLGRASSAPVGRLFAAISAGYGARISFDFGASCPVAVSGCSEKGV